MRNRKRLVAKDFRREGVYNRTEKPSVTFCGEEEQRNEREGAFLKQKSRRKRYKACDDVVWVRRFELPASGRITSLRSEDRPAHAFQAIHRMA